VRFIVDACTGPAVARHLAALGHDIFSVHDQAPTISDVDILVKAVAETRIVITNDKDFGEKVFRDGMSHCGVIFLRLQDERPPEKIRVPDQLLLAHAAALSNQFVVCTETQTRFSSP
jgi:predicted nuclease of predicted toxin-antitoxin system